MERKPIDTQDIARAMLEKLAQCAGRAACREKKLSNAEKRRLLRLRKVKDLRNGNLQ